MTKSKLVGGMRFRDLAMYNDSLLAKKSWRLLHNTDSLFYKVFKARFFPNYSIVEVRDSRSAPYAWRSILKGRAVIQRGSRSHIGNERAVKIRQNHWLPQKHPPLVFFATLKTMEEATVDILVNNLERQWYNNIIDGIFTPEEAELIKRIPLAKLETNDSVFWPLTQDGVYTCESSYRFLKEEAEYVDRSEELSQDKELWKGFWSLFVPNKVKNFL